MYSFLRYGTLKEIDTNISRREGETDDNLTLTEIVCPEHIAEVCIESFSGF
jgi:hypothetical protein